MAVPNYVSTILYILPWSKIKILKYLGECMEGEGGRGLNDIGQECKKQH